MGDAPCPPRPAAGPGGEPAAPILGCGGKAALPLTVLLVCLCAVAVVFFWKIRREPAPEEALANVGRYRVVRGDIASAIQLSGKVQYLTSQLVQIPTSARISEQLVANGDHVKEGQPLIRFDENDLFYKYAVARGNYLKAKSRLEELENWNSSLSSVTARFRLENAEAEYGLKQKAFEDNKVLYAEKAISKQSLEESEEELRRARADLEIARVELKETLSKGDAASFEVARSELTVAEIDFQKAKSALALKTVTAPISGVVTIQQKNAEAPAAGSLAQVLLGSVGTEASEIFISIVDQSSYAVQLNVDEFDVTRIRIGQPCRITIPAYSRQILTGSVIAINPSPSQETGKTFYAIRCGLDEKNLPILIGMTADVDMLLEEKPDVVKVPLTAVAREGGTSGVFVVDKGDKPRFQKVSIGINDGRFLEITDGLSEGQEILLTIPDVLLAEDVDEIQ